MSTRANNFSFAWSARRSNLVRWPIEDMLHFFGSFMLKAMNEVLWWSRCWWKLSTADGSWISWTEVALWTMNGSISHATPPYPSAHPTSSPPNLFSNSHYDECTSFLITKLPKNERKFIPKVLKVHINRIQLYLFSARPREQCNHNP